MDKNSSYMNVEILFEPLSVRKGAFSLELALCGSSAVGFSPGSLPLHQQHNPI